MRICQSPNHWPLNTGFAHGWSLGGLDLGKACETNQRNVAWNGCRPLDLADHSALLHKPPRRTNHGQNRPISLPALRLNGRGDPNCGGRLNGGDAPVNGLQKSVFEAQPICVLRLRYKLNEKT